MRKLLLAMMLAGPVFGAAAADLLTMSYEVAGLYDDKSYDTPNYYLMLSDKEDAAYNYKTGAVTLNEGYVLVLDLYNVATDPLALPEGTYKVSDDMAAFTISSDASQLSYYTAGRAKSTVVSSPVTVKMDGEGIYTLETTVSDPKTGKTRDLKYSGRLPIVNVNEKPASFPMLRKDVTDVDIKHGGIAYYYGVTDYSGNGVTALNFYSSTFDQTTGALTGDGINLSMMIVHKRMTKDKYKIESGEYFGAQSFARNTWYPCREIEYNIGDYMSVPFGSMIRMRENGGEYVYGYLKTGKLTIEFNPETKEITGKLDAYTDLGYHVTANLGGTIIYDLTAASVPPAVSNLIDDVELDLDYLEKGRLWHRGEKAGCRAFTLDLGSPAGRDSDPGVAADLLRVEFFTPWNHTVVEPGLYTVVSRRWNSNELEAGGTYDPMSIGQGWAEVDGGTSYRHFQEGLTYVYDYFAPVQSGTIRVDTQDYINYSFEINLQDDAEFRITGTWLNKPVELMYDREALQKEVSGISAVEADKDALCVVTEGRNIVVLNAADAPVALYDLNGRVVLTGTADQALDASGCSAGVYVLVVSNKTVKVVLK
ncbi:MAG: T9SS type A sorting domain-containing protein [Paramuribaculum sp.]|nr:T9SS type A sorting domain-containing protein [Paramuribaculum sp.]